MSVKLLTEQHLEFLSSKGDWTGSSESTLFKIPHCWKSRRYSFVMNSRKRVSSVFVCFVALRPKSTAMVIAGRSVYLTTLFPGQA